MPELDGLSALGYIMSETPRPVVMLSAGTTNTGHEAALRALELGAVDFVLKPSGSISLDLAVISGRLLDALRAAKMANPIGLRMLPRPEIDAMSSDGAMSPRATRAIVIASSTGGPRALAAIVPQLTRPMSSAVLMVQHMPPGFTKSMARRLDAVSPLRIDEAQDGEPVVIGRGYVAPGGLHMTVTNDGGGPRHHARRHAADLGRSPAADMLFRSAATVFGASALAVVLTGWAATARRERA
jgi:two-component system chemotaxis response regulator CheB